MVDRQRSRREYLTLEAFDPIGGSVCDVQVSFDRMQTVGRRSMGHAKECGFIVPEILRRPTNVFEGFRSDGDEDPRGAGWRCYCGVPSVAYHADGTERKPFPGQVYLVFVNDDRVAYNWRWEEADPDNPQLPQNHASRFTKKLL